MARPFDIVLVSCTARKRDHETTAENLYVSDWFLKAKRIASEYGGRWFILSAKHGLLTPDSLIEPYDQSLDAMPARDKEVWGLGVSQKLAQLFDADLSDRSVLLLAGQSYRNYVQRHLLANGARTCAPLSDLGIGRQLKYLNDLSGLSTRVMEQRLFYEQLLRLRPRGQDFVRLKDLRSTDVPPRGVYFFMEDGQDCRLQPDTKRIVRVGTHAVSAGSKSTLWQRLRAHRGLDSGGGSHRSSIFRLHVGNCIRSRDGIGPSTWAVGDSAAKEIREAETQLEELVSKYIGKLRVAILPINDQPGPDSDRSFIEMNSIGLLTNEPIVDLPSASWLGGLSPVKQISASGLWNINYVGTDFHPRLLETLERTIDRGLSPSSAVADSLAPVAWRMNKSSTKQIQLFE